MQVYQALALARERLAAAGIEEGEAQMMARLLLAAHCGVALRDLPLQLRQETDPAPLLPQLEQLAQGEPIQYLLGSTEFMGLPFLCRPQALIPRLDSETLVERAITLLADLAAPRIADICTGSGAYALALAYHLPGSRVVACDISAAALALAVENRERLGLAERVSLRQGDLLAPLAEDGAVYDLICANPPYIPSAELAALPPQVRREPRLALDGGPDGLAIYRRLLPAVPGLLRPGGYLLLEHGDDQAEALRALLLPSGLQLREELYDLAGRPRGLLAQLS